MLSPSLSSPRARSLLPLCPGGRGKPGRASSGREESAPGCASPSWPRAGERGRGGAEQREVRSPGRPARPLPHFACLWAPLGDFRSRGAARCRSSPPSLPGRGPGAYGGGAGVGGTSAARREWAASAGQRGKEGRGGRAGSRTCARQCACSEGAWGARRRLPSP